MFYLDEISYKVWVVEGSMMYPAETLHFTHPMHPYNQVAALGVKPEDYGLVHPIAEAYSSMSRDELLHELTKLSIENYKLHTDIDALYRAEAAGYFERNYK